MEPFRYHVFVCTQQKPEGTPCCSAGGSTKLLEVLQGELQKQGLFNHVQVTSCGCLGLCDNGPDMITYPDGIWYTGLKPEHIIEIVRSHFAEGRPVAEITAKGSGHDEVGNPRTSRPLPGVAKGEGTGWGGDVTTAFRSVT